MAETSLLKRVREEEYDIDNHQQEEEEEREMFNKRQKSYKDIITLLEEEEDDPNEDLSSLVSTLLEEISSPGSDRVQSGPTEPGSEVEGVMRHLLEASDDELGLPSNNSSSGGDVDSLDGGHVDGGDLFGVGDGLWEFEDHEANNYYNNLLELENEVFM